MENSSTGLALPTPECPTSLHSLLLVAAPMLLPMLLALAAFLCGWLLPSPLSAGAGSSPGPTSLDQPQRARQLEAAKGADGDWYVGPQDLQEFRGRVEDQVTVPGAGAWQPLLEKDTPGSVRYTAVRRSLPGNMTEYLTTTITPGATAEEVFDFSLDDGWRAKWEGFMMLAQLLERGSPPEERQQVVRYVRHFPMGFITDREYVIARRAFRVDGALYAITKGLDHPGAADAAAASGTAGVVRIEKYASAWRCRTVPDPWGGPEPACEQVLLHCEGMRIPEYLAKMAIRVGMLNYVKEMTGAMPGFLAERRSRAGPTEDDPLAYSLRAPSDAGAGTSGGAGMANGYGGGGGGGGGSSDAAPPTLWENLFGGRGEQGPAPTRSDALRLPSAMVESDAGWTLGDPPRPVAAAPCLSPVPASTASPGSPSVASRDGGGTSAGKGSAAGSDGGLITAAVRVVAAGRRRKSGDQAARTSPFEAASRDVASGRDGRGGGGGKPIKRLVGAVLMLAVGVLAGRALRQRGVRRSRARASESGSE